MEENFKKIFLGRSFEMRFFGKKAFSFPNVFFGHHLVLNRLLLLFLK